MVVLAKFMLLVKVLSWCAALYSRVEPFFPDNSTAEFNLSLQLQSQLNIHQFKFPHLATHTVSVELAFLCHCQREWHYNEVCRANYPYRKATRKKLLPIVARP